MWGPPNKFQIQIVLNSISSWNRYLLKYNSIGIFGKIHHLLGNLTSSAWMFVWGKGGNHCWIKPQSSRLGFLEKKLTQLRVFIYLSNEVQVSTSVSFEKSKPGGPNLLAREVGDVIRSDTHMFKWSCSYSHVEIRCTIKILFPPNTIERQIEIKRFVEFFPCFLFPYMHSHLSQPLLSFLKPFGQLRTQNMAGHPAEVDALAGGGVTKPKTNILLRQVHVNIFNLEVRTYRRGLGTSLTPSWSRENPA